MVWWKKAKASEPREGDQVQENTPGNEVTQEPGAEGTADVVEDVTTDEPAEIVAAAGDSAQAESTAEVTDEAEAPQPGTAADEPVEAEEPTQASVPAEATAAAEPAQAADESAEAGTVEADSADDVDNAADTTQAAVAPVDATNSAESAATEDTAEMTEPAPDFAAPVSTTFNGSDTVVSPVSSSAGVPVTAKKPTGHRLRNTLFTVAGSILGAALLVTGCGALGVSYFDSHAKPGTELAGQNVTGFSTAQVRNVAATLIENYTAKLEFEGRQANATAKDLGVTFDLDQTVRAVMNAGSGATLSDRYNPFNIKKTILVMSVDEDQLQNYLNDTFISADKRSEPAGITYDADQGGFTVQPGKDGTKADAVKVGQELKAGEGMSDQLTVATTAEAPRITTDSAQQTADQANQFLTVPYTVTAASKSYTIPASDIAPWLQFVPDQDAGVIHMGVDTAQATADLQTILTSDDLKQAAVSRQTLLTPDGRVMGVQRAGSLGTEIAHPDEVAADIVQALVSGTGYSSSVETADTKLPDESTTIQEGVKWVEVNRSSYTVTRWEGSTSLSTWSVVIGKPSTPTYPGIFHVWAKVRIQDMKGADYVQPNVPWVAYFDGDRALHGNYWVGNFGWGSSHGCVGMPVAQAEIMYNWIEMGTLVWVHD